MRNTGGRSERSARRDPDIGRPPFRSLGHLSKGCQASGRVAKRGEKVAKRGEKVAKRPAELEKGPASTSAKKV